MSPLLPLFLEGLKQKLFGGLFEDIGLIMIGLKLVILMFIVSWVRQRFGNSVLATVLTLGIGYIVLFQQWYVFGPLMVIYLLIVFGFSAVLIDMAITKPWSRHAWTGKYPGGAEQAGELETETGHRKMEELRHQQKMFRGGMH